MKFIPQAHLLFTVLCKAYSKFPQNIEFLRQRVDSYQTVLNLEHLATTVKIKGRPFT
jgi:hypothetical protein